MSSPLWYRLPPSTRAERAATNRRTPRRRGVVLVVVLVVVAVLALAAYAFHDVMMAENEVTQMVGRQIQAYSLAASGVADLQVFLMQDAATQVGSRRAVRQCGQVSGR